jgi:thioredoxin-related protein
MTKLKLARLFCATSLLISPLHAEFRDWSNSEGVKINAEMVKADDTNVTLRMMDGRLSIIPQTKLSLADQVFIKANKDTTATTDKKLAVEANRKARWLTSMDRAKKESAETGLPILVLFTGSTWCPYCIKLEKEVFAEKEFKTFANQNLVLLKLDYGPGGSSKNSEEKKLSKDFAVTGFPTYFLTDSTGKTLGKDGYREGITPDKFSNWAKTTIAKK